MESGETFGVGYWRGGPCGDGGTEGETVEGTEGLRVGVESERSERGEG